ncbi:MAG: prepilin-type N-terminal cleavage/methylation domain-containing protein [Phycisphaeraceae bacterium]|nr:prepilin-type N-terminal cleavage/methylation domain-containing protein [Phycisphaeraceae bacterium]
MAASPPFSSARMPIRVHRAFSLFELVVVLSILTIFASIAAPKYAGAVSRYKLDAAARRVAADLERSRALARASGSNWTIRFVPSSNSYSIVGLVVGSSKGSDYTVRLGSPPYSITLESADFAGSKDLQFGGFGCPAIGGTIVLRGGVDKRSIVVDSASGAVSIQ